MESILCQQVQQICVLIMSRHSDTNRGGWKRLSRPWGLCVRRTGATFTGLPSCKVTLNGLMSLRTLCDPWPGARMALCGWHTAPWAPALALALHHSPKAVIKSLQKSNAYYSQIGFIYFLTEGGILGWMELWGLAMHGLWFNVITKLNSSTREEMLSTWVCLYVCVCDCVWEVSESHWRH